MFSRPYRWQDIYPDMMPTPMKDEPPSAETVGTDTCRYCGQLITTPYCTHCGAPRPAHSDPRVGRVVFESHDDDEEHACGEMKVRRELIALKDAQAELVDSLRQSVRALQGRP